MELARGRDNTAFVNDGLEDRETVEIHSSPYENVLFIIIHFTGSPCNLKMRVLRISEQQALCGISQLVGARGSDSTPHLWLAAVCAPGVPTPVSAREHRVRCPGTLWR